MMTPELATNERPSERRWLSPAQLGMDAGYCIGGFPVALLRFVLLVTLFAVGVGTAVIGIGVPILVLTLYVARRFADVERQWSARVRGRVIERPEYLGRDRRTGLKRLITPMTEAQSWLDLIWGIFAFIPATIAFALSLSWWVAGIAGPLYALWSWPIPREHNGLPWLLGLGDSYLVGVVFYTALGLVMLVTAPLVTSVLSLGSRMLSRAMLTSDWVHGPR